MAGLIVALLVSLSWCVFAVWLGPRMGFVDHPDDPSLKVHERAAVPLGGVGVYLAVHAAGLMEGKFDIILVTATSIVLVLGLVDDRRGLPPLARLVVEVAAAGVLVLGLVGDKEPWFILALAIGIVVFAINAVNLFDGLDGLAGSVGLVAALGLAGLAVGRGLDGELSLSLAAGLLGFLALGWHPARVFLGDAGAYVVGVTLAASIATSSPGSARDLLVAATVLGVFAIDLVVTVLRRLRNTRPLFEGDRSHVYDQLRDRGMSVPHVVLVAAATQAALVIVTVLVDRVVPGWTGVVVLVVVWGLCIALLAGSGYLSVDSSRDP